MTWRLISISSAQSQIKSDGTAVLLQACRGLSPEAVNQDQGAARLATSHRCIRKHSKVTKKSLVFDRRVIFPSAGVLVLIWWSMDDNLFIELTGDDEGFYD